MTVIKQRAVTDREKGKALCASINNRKFIMQDFQNISDKSRWAYEMDVTREVSGHNRAAREGSKNTILYDQILAFLSDECDMNGGKMTAEMCMLYAKEYAATRYPNQQIVFTLYCECSEATKTGRYFIRMIINRTDLLTRKRLHEGTGKQAKWGRVQTIRKLDQKYGLKQLERGKTNS